MSQETAKSRRKRWRWIIIAGGLLLAVGVLGWACMRHDTRLVGRWEGSYVEHVSPKRPSRRVRWKFDANGRCSITNEAGVETAGKWAIAGDVLFVDDLQRTLTTWETLDRLFISLTGKNPYKTHAFTVSLTEPDQVRLSAPGREYVLTRQPD